MGNTGVRYERINTTKPPADFFEGPLHRLIIGHIKDNASNLAFFESLGQDRMDFFQTGFINVGYNHNSASSEQAICHAKPDGTATSSNKGNLSAEGRGRGPT
jgi:hypothetical protein